MKRTVSLMVMLCMMLVPALAGAADGHGLPLLFSDGAVVQRGKSLPVWGQAGPGEAVRVEFAGKEARVVAGQDGRWSLMLPASVAGGPHVMRITEGSRVREFHDILVGDVWLASGQSNMEWPIAQSAQAEAEIAAATDRQIRHFKIPKSWDGVPQAQLAGGSWVAASPQAAGSFSAAAHFMARELRKSEGVPIGIIDSTWGGSRIETWMDAATLGLDPQAAAESARQAREADERALQETGQRLARWPQGVADDTGWEQAGLDDTDWVAIPVPGIWESSGWIGMDGVAWYRTTFTLSKEEAATGVLLGLGRIDDSDIAFVNGQRVGETTLQYNEPREYQVPASALRAGTNQVAVRVTDSGGGGGIHGEQTEIFVQPAGGERRPLDGSWVFRVADAVLTAGDDNKNQFPTLVYNRMIHPVQPYPLRGVIWYQGESNAFSVDEATRYREQFPALIRQWRSQWNAPDLPFLWVQLAGFGTGVDVEEGGTVQVSPWSVMRESQTATLSLPATAEVVTIDIGDQADIHPRNKQDVGKRLALAARKVAYGEDVVHAGPSLTKVAFANGAAVVEFDTHGSALAVRSGGNDVQGFVLAGADRVFKPARAVIEGDRIVVRADGIPAPVAVRYAWSDNPANADLVGTTGLPASPFRSDTW